MEQKLFRIREIILYILIIVGPFHAFLITWLRSFLESSFLLGGISIWREVLALVFVGICTLELLKEKKWPRCDLLDWLIIAFIGVALVFFPFQESITQWILGFRFDVMPFVVLLATRQVTWRESQKYIKVLLIIAAIVMIFGLLHALILPKDFLTHFGYSLQQGAFQPELAISDCQYLEHTENVCRATATFASPMRYGAYLLFTLGLLVSLIKTHSPLRLFAAILLPLTYINIALTYSRSMWIGAFFLTVVGLFLIIPKKWYVKIAIGTIGLIFISGIFLFNLSNKKDDVNHTGWRPPPFIETVFLRVSSTSEHWKHLQTSIEQVKENPLGLGLGTAGPASLRFEKLVTENWYFQIAVEMGIIGVGLFIGILFLLTKKFFKNRNDWLSRGLLLSLIGISISALFIHAFEETSMMLVLAVLGGTALRSDLKSKEKSST